MREGEGDGLLADGAAGHGSGDESKSETESVTGIPPVTQPKIQVSTYADPYPVVPPLTTATSGGQSGKRPAPLRSKGGKVHEVKKVSLRLGSAATFKRHLDRVLESETAARPGVPVRQILAEMLVDAALAGDKWAFEQVLDRTEGKPAQTLDITKRPMSALGDLPDDVLERLRAMAAKKVETAPDNPPEEPKA